MNKKFYFSITVALLIVLSACNNSVRQEKEPEAELNKCTRYTCPMHPDVTSTALTRCPKCNMPMVVLPDSLKKDSIKSGKK